MNLQSLINTTAALAVAGLALAPVAASAATPDAAQAIKEAAKAHIAATSPTISFTGLDISRVKDDYVSVSARPGGESVVLQYTNEAWKPILGPTPIFAPGQRAGAPDILFDYVNPYVGQQAQDAINRITVERKQYDAGFLKFEYAADAVVTKTGANELTITGPKVREQIYNGPAYEITIKATGEKILGPLDEWGYGKMLERMKEMQNDAGRAAPPQFATYFELDNVNVFQTDWFGGDSYLREFWIGPKAGGVATRIETRVYPVENNPGAPQGESAVNLLLHTLALPEVSIMSPGVEETPVAVETPVGGVGQTPGMPRTGEPEGGANSLLLLLIAAGAGVVAAGATLGLRSRRQRG